MTDPASPVVVRLEVDGGFAYLPGLDRPVTADSRDLSPEDASRLRSLLDEVGLATRPVQESGPPPGAADMRAYRITVVPGEGDPHVLRVSDPIEDPAVQALVDHVRAVGRPDA